MHGDAAPLVRVLLLGPVAIARDDRVVPVVGRQQAAILALLASRLGRSLPSGTLIDEAWRGSAPHSAASALRVHIAKIRAELSDGDLNPVSHGPGGYRIDPGLVGTDVVEFERLVTSGRAQHDPTASLVDLDHALFLWRGAPFAGVEDVGDLQQVADRLTLLRLDAEDDRIDVRLRLGHHAELAPEIAALISAEPLRERRTRQLMVALYRSGRQAEALAAYGRLRRELVDQLGIDPSPETRRLEAAVLRQDESLALAVTGTDHDGWEAASALALAPGVVAPRSSGQLLHDLVTQRLNGLGATDAALVGLVAVLGDMAQDALLAEALGIEVTEVASSVARGYAAGLLGPPQASGPRWMSRPALAEELLAAMSSSERATLHDTAAAVIGRVLPTSAAARVVAVRHRLLACRLRSSVDDSTAFAVVEAVDTCLAGQHVDAARSLCVDALGHPGLPRHVVVDLMTRLVRALSRLGEVAHADELSRQGIELARELGDPQRFALMVLARDWTLRVVLGGDDERRLLEEALSALASPSALRVRVASALVLESAVPGRPSDVGELLSDVERHARELGDDMSLRSALYARHAAARASPDQVMRGRISDELWSLCQGCDDPEWRAWAALARIHDAFVACDHDSLEELIGVFESISTRVRSPRLMWHHALMRAARSFDQGDLATSEHWANEAMLLGATAGHPDTLAAAAVHSMQTHFHRRSLAAFVPTIEEYGQLVPDHILVQAAGALASACTGRHDDAIAALTDLSRRFAHGEADEFTVFAAAVCAEAVSACSGEAHVGWVREILAPFAGQFVVFGQVTATWGPVDRLLGLLAGIADRREEALSLIRSGEALAERSGLELWRARCSADYALVQARLAR